MYVIMFGFRYFNSIQFLIDVLLKILTQQNGGCVKSMCIFPLYSDNWWTTEARRVKVNMETDAIYKGPAQKLCVFQYGWNFADSLHPRGKQV
jgi:hypothetical protein